VIQGPNPESACTLVGGPTGIRTLVPPHEWLRPDLALRATAADAMRPPLILPARHS